MTRVRMRGLVHIRSPYTENVTGCARAFDAPFRMTDEPLTCFFCITAARRWAGILSRAIVRRAR